MSFDPFGDFEERGYLQNSMGLKDPDAIQIAEHRSFLRNMPDAVEHLQHLDRITYQDVLDTHKILFGDFYPWAGQDRTSTAPEIAIAKGGRSDLFTHPQDAKYAVDYALNLAQDKGAMGDRPGEVIGYLSHGHPFLDGNGRTIIVIANELAQREGISIDWESTNKNDYLAALTRELENPGKGELDSYLDPYIREARPHDELVRTTAELPGLGPNSSASPPQPSLEDEAQRAEQAARDAARGRRDEVGRIDGQREPESVSAAPQPDISRYPADEVAAPESALDEQTRQAEQAARDAARGRRDEIGRIDGAPEPQTGRQQERAAEREEETDLERRFGSAAAERIARMSSRGKENEGRGGRNDDDDDGGRER